MLSFDTRDQKPKLFHLALLTVIVGSAVAALLITGEGEWLKRVSFILTAYFYLAVIFLLDAFRKQLQYNPYSYNTIIYFGFALFFLSVAVTFTAMAIQCIQDPESFREAQMLFTLLHSAKNYMFLTSPFLIVFALLLFISNCELIRHEGMRFVNILGILLAFVLVAGEALIGFLDYRSALSGEESVLQNLFVNLMAAFYLYFECMIIGSAAADIIAARYKAQKNKDMLIVLGCGLKNDGSPTPLLCGRLDLALKFWRDQLREAGKKARFVVSGGKGPDEVQPEAAAMKDYLRSKGVSEDLILVEDRSSDTAENMRFSKKKIDAVDPNASVAFFTTNYHVFRAGIKARQVKMRAVGMGASTKWYFWPNAAVREFVGLLSEHRVKQGLIAFALIGFYTVLTVLVYA